MADPDHQELLDVYDEAGAWVGTKGRAAVHADGDWHRCFHLWVLSEGGVLLQRRAAHKASWPGKLDATAAGHVGAGEEVAKGGAREVREELGVAYDALVPLGVRAMSDGSGGLVNREFQHVFVVADERPLEAWTGFDRSELDGLVRMRLADLSALVHDGREEVAGESWDGERVERVTVAAGELLPAPYLPTLTIMLERFARGERPLAI